MSTPDTHSIRVLLVEDDQDQRTAVEGYLLRPSSAYVFVVSFARSLAEAITAAAATTPDVILLDLNLTDSAGLATLDALRAEVEVPIVVLTALTDPDLAPQVLRHGAEDYIPKDTHVPRLLARTLFYAVERRRLQSEVTRVEAEASLLREAQALRAVGRPQLSVTAEILGERALRLTAPEQFAVCVAEFRAATQLAIDAQSYVGRQPDPRPVLLKLSQRLGSLRAGPTDIVELYREAIRFSSGSVPAGPDSAWREEARLMLIGLLGHVLSFYRLRAVDDGRPGGGSSQEMA